MKAYMPDHTLGRHYRLAITPCSTVDQMTIGGSVNKQEPGKYLSLLSLDFRE